MAIATRLKRLETAVAGTGEPGRKSFDEVMADLAADSQTIASWLKQHGYDNALEAHAAGETGPALLTDRWTLATFAEIERDTVEERIFEIIVPELSLCCHRDRGWCALINGRLVYLGPSNDYHGTLARFRSLSCQSTGAGRHPEDANLRVS